jgi:hypothetical protein
MIDINRTSDEARELMRRAAHVLEQAARGRGPFADINGALTAIAIATTAIESATALLRQLKGQRTWETDCD